MGASLTCKPLEGACWRASLGFPTSFFCARESRSWEGKANVLQTSTCFGRAHILGRLHTVVESCNESRQRLPGGIRACVRGYSLCCEQLSCPEQGHGRAGTAPTSYRQGTKFDLSRTRRLGHHNLLPELRCVLQETQRLLSEPGGCSTPGCASSRLPASALLTCCLPQHLASAPPLQNRMLDTLTSSFLVQSSLHIKVPTRRAGPVHTALLGQH